ASNPHPLGDPSNAPLTAINTMIYIGNIEILTAKSAIYLGNVGSSSQEADTPKTGVGWEKG
ncbi:hypothetical protein, partial [Sphingomonas sp. S-NIH.Pt1_0416]|uniref:hypothetical protein n=1 Tax=Sphingomonas sp. S-NIH.Pt1_0416 TaxID=1920123 RepID=UPI0019D0BE20